MKQSRGFTIWLTGMNASGKSTLARYLGERLPLLGKGVEILDQNELEGFFPDDPDTPEEIRNRNDRQLGWMARLLTRNGVITVVAAVSSNREVREELRREIGRFYEVFVDSPFEVLQQRDEKKIYERALEGTLQNVVGIHTPYEPPNLAELRLDSSDASVESLGEAVFRGLYAHGFVTKGELGDLVGDSPPSRLKAMRAAAKRARSRAGEPIAAAVEKVKSRAQSATASKGAAKAAEEPAAAKKAAKKAAAKKSTAEKAPPAAEKAPAKKGAAAEKLGAEAKATGPKKAAAQATSAKKSAKKEAPSSEKATPARKARRSSTPAASKPAAQKAPKASRSRAGAAADETSEVG